MSHTPGPWTLETVKTQVGHCHKIGPFPGSCGRNPAHACVYVDGPHAPRAQVGNDQELLANARLIAAAPDLLAAVQYLLETMPEPAMQSHSFDEPPDYASRDDYELAHAIWNARAAIAKAIGTNNTEKK